MKVQIQDTQEKLTHQLHKKTLREPTSLRSADLLSLSCQFRILNPQDPQILKILEGDPKMVRLVPKRSSFCGKSLWNLCFACPKLARDPKMVRLVPKTELFLSQTPLESVFFRSRTANFRRSSSDPKTVRLVPKTGLNPFRICVLPSKTAADDARTNGRTHMKNLRHSHNRPFGQKSPLQCPQTPHFFAPAAQKSTT